MARRLVRGQRALTAVQENYRARLPARQLVAAAPADLPALPSCCTASLPPTLCCFNRTSGEGGRCRDGGGRGVPTSADIERRRGKRTSSSSILTLGRIGNVTGGGAAEEASAGRAARDQRTAQVRRPGNSTAFASCFHCRRRRQGAAFASCFHCRRRRQGTAFASCFQPSRPLQHCLCLVLPLPSRLRRCVCPRPSGTGGAAGRERGVGGHGRVCPRVPGAPEAAPLAQRGGALLIRWQPLSFVLHALVNVEGGCSRVTGYRPGTSRTRRRCGPRSAIGATALRRRRRRRRRRRSGRPPPG